MQRIFIDMDNVITDYSYSACEWFNDELGRPKYKKEYPTNLEPKDIKEYSMWKNYFLPKHIGKPLQNKMFEDPEFWRMMDPVQGALNSIRKLNEKYEIYIATAARYNDVCVQEKVDWIKKHLPCIHEERIVFTMNKGILYGDILVDDFWKYLFQFEGRSILFLQPYNKNRYDQFGYVVSNWIELEKLLNETF